MPRVIRAIIVSVLGLAAPAAIWGQPPPGGFQPLPSPNQPASGWPTFTSPNPSFAAPASNTSSLAPARTPEGEAFELAETVAQVGDQYIFKGELIGEANLILSNAFAQLEKLPPEQRERAREELLEAREQLVREQLLKQAIERKLKFLEFMRSIPQSDAKKADEIHKRIQSQAGKRFAEQLEETLTKVVNAKEQEEFAEIARSSPQLYRIALVMKDNHIRSVDDPELDQVLKAHQTSLAKQRQAYTESAVGQAAMSQKINFQPEITHAQMVTYYREHESEFQVETRAQWEQMTVLFQRFPNEQAAFKAICEMGDEVLWGGAPFWAVAKRKSQEKNASLGGFHDWTNYGDLKVSKQINDAVFSYELNALSPIIRDDKGFHIIRVTDRQTAHVRPFSDAQSDIKEKLRVQLVNKAYTDYVAKLWQRTPVLYADAYRPPANRMAKPTFPNGSVSR